MYMVKNVHTNNVHSKIVCRKTHRVDIWLFLKPLLFHVMYKVRESTKHINVQYYDLLSSLIPNLFNELKHFRENSKAKPPHKIESVT